MKSLITLCAACVLALVFTLAVRADDGQISTGASARPNPTSPAPRDGHISTDRAGHIEIGAPVGTTIIDPVTQFASSVLSVVAALV